MKFPINLHKTAFSLVWLTYSVYWQLLTENSVRLIKEGKEREIIAILF